MQPDICQGVLSSKDTIDCQIERFGMGLIMAPGYENMAWYGRGPAPTYVDRDYERVGVYRSTVDQQWNEFSQPQENSNKTDVRWVTLTNQDGIGLRATGMSLLSVSAYQYPKSEIERADYAFKMTRRPQIYLNLDLRQMGVGGTNSWTPDAYPLEPYRIRGDEPHSHKYRLAPTHASSASRTNKAITNRAKRLIERNED
jgi:beta-galactosidase